MVEQRNSLSDPVTIDSDALRANLEETATKDVIVDPAYGVLSEIVGDMAGIRKNLDSLLYEISHPYRNWIILIPKLRTFILKNVNIYRRHKKGPQALVLFISIFLDALVDSKKNETLQYQIMEAILAFVEKIVNLLDPTSLAQFEKALADCFSRLYELDDPSTMFIVQGHHPMKKIAARLLKLSDDQAKDGAEYNFTPATLLFQKILTLNYQYWLNEKDPLAWFTNKCGVNEGEPCDGWEAGKLFTSISHDQMSEHLKNVNDIDTGEAEAAIGKLLQFPAHIDIVRLYKAIPDKLAEVSTMPVTTSDRQREAEEPTGDRFVENRKLLFLFMIMETKGLALIHEETLREINRSLVQLIRQQSFEEIESFLLTTFQLLKINVRRYPLTSMQCIQVLGNEIFDRGNSRLVEAFLWQIVRFGFQFANVAGVDEDWQPITNPAHLANIRVWLNLIMQEPKWCSILFSALIINLKLSGTCVRDTDLFQRDISQLLNHPIEPIYNLAKQFTKLMPVFFNEIGAEGDLRDVSTEIDEIHKRQDILIHFLRKQSHVESSNLIVGFIQAIFEFWACKDKKLLTPYLPEEVLAQVKTEGPLIKEVHILAKRALEHQEIESIEDILLCDSAKCNAFLAEQSDISSSEIKRFGLLVEMYKLLYQKYNLGFQELRQQLVHAANSGFPEMEELLADLEICDTHQCLKSLLKHLEALKEIILSDETFEAREDIYYKRHIAVDIPSVYGRYSERKFDALGLTFRLENLANIYLERLPETVNLSFITQATFIRIIKCLKLYLRALKVDGITSRRLDTYLSLLSNSLHIKRFSFTQYLDIFRGLSVGVKDVIYAYYTNIHQSNLSIIIPQIGSDNLLTKYRPHWNEEDPQNSINQLSEYFFRDLIAGTFGLQHLDNFITRILQTLENQKELLDEKSLDLLMTYNPHKAISFLHNKNQRANNLILLGNKGYNLMQLASDNKPVPTGFIITTELFRCWPVVKKFDMARDDFMRQVRNSINEIEKKTGKKYGDARNPLLLSVRSGAAISMPGMMTTIHNIGLNQEIAEDFSKISGNEYLAWDNFRRFVQSWAMAKGMVREDFQALMNAAKTRHDVKVKRKFTPDQMKELALEYHKAVRNKGFEIPDDPWLQLIGSVEMVIDSWNAYKTKEYRNLMDTSDSWGTAAIVQAMVYGNLGPSSGSGVVFTAHPYRKVRRVALWGDYAFSVQGEDIVSGLVTTYPISKEQAAINERSFKNTLEERFPEIYQALLSFSRELVYEKQWNPQEIEFTFESPEPEDLYILQTRDMITIKKKEKFNVFTETKKLQKNILGKGIGVSGSAISGRAVFTVENIQQLKKEDPKTPLILIRQDTVPEDIKEIAMAEGLVTARGGQTSHAAVVATQLEKTCVVGCKTLKVYESAQYCEINGQTIKFGDQLSIDGRHGYFIKGAHPFREEIQILPL